MRVCSFGIVSAGGSGCGCGWSQQALAWSPCRLWCFFFSFRNLLEVVSFLRLSFCEKSSLVFVGVLQNLELVSEVGWLAFVKMGFKEYWKLGPGL